MSAEARGEAEKSTRAGWLILCAVVGFIVPLGGYLVAFVATRPRFRRSAPRASALVAVATVVLVIQLVGLMALPSSGA